MVAAGSYKPDRGTGDLTATFQLSDGVGIYGGFSAHETTRDQRDPRKHLTILSGDLCGDDSPVCPATELADQRTRPYNSLHVVTVTGAAATAILDGFTIAGGNANGHENDCIGGGLLCEDGAPPIANCVFHANSARRGGGVCTTGRGGPSLVGCAFLGNLAAKRGAGLASLGETAPQLTNCVFSGNVANGPYGSGKYGAGGAAFISGHSHPALVNCTLTRNQAFDTGGIWCEEQSATILVNCIVWGQPEFEAGTGDQAETGIDAYGVV